MEQYMLIWKKYRIYEKENEIKYESAINLEWKSHTP